MLATEYEIACAFWLWWAVSTLHVLILLRTPQFRTMRPPYEKDPQGNAIWNRAVEKSTQGSRRGTRALLLTLAFTAGLVGLASGLRGHYDRFLAEHYRRQLDTVPDDRAETLIKQVAQLEEAGIPVLVEALGSERKSVAVIGKRAILEEIDRWETLCARDFSPRLAILAEALADQTSGFGPAAQADAADLAARILFWPLDDTSVDRRKVIASCETVLRATSLNHGQLAESPPSDRFENAAPDDLYAQEKFPAEDRPRDLTGGALPGEMSPATEPSTAQTDEARVADVRSVESRDPESPSLKQPLRVLTEPDGAKPIPAFPNPAHADDPPLLRPTTFLSRPPEPTSDSINSDRQSSELAGIDTITLMRRLQTGSVPMVAGVRRELEQRGFNSLHLQLAQRLFDPNPEVRKELARLLPGLSSVDAPSWLLWLSRDEDPSVRRVAIGLMATTGDPALLDEIERIARRDPDPDIQRQAERIAQQRRAADN